MQPDRRDGSPANHVISARVTRPQNMIAHSFEMRRTLEVDAGHLWRWLNTPETFTRQVWPYWVEFVEASGVDGGGGFEPGVLNVHHGPFLHCAGVISAIDAWPPEDGGSASRELLYYYGSFIVSMRWIRPRRLTFTVGEIAENKVDLQLTVECDVRPWLAGTWTRLQGIFWRSFFKSAKRGALRAARMR